ncbi:MAG: type I polyketide synthase, partial [Pseudomonadota bacterium]
AFSQHVTVNSEAVIKLSETLDLDLAAGLPVAFLTAHYALIDRANLSAGETVLIHGAAGGVGQAAIQVAHAVGARVFCTAGTEEKREYLECLGPEGVFDSRNLAFVSGVERATSGAGVDVVLNCLAGDAMEASLRLVRSFGRFLELGKQDLYGNRHIGIRPLRNNVSYFAIDLDQLMASKPEQMLEILGQTINRFEEGIYRSIPTQTFSASAAKDAFRSMQSANHLGKILVKPPERLEDASEAPLDLSGTWLVTGGFSGLGLASAEWLAQKGANTIWLVSRTGEPRSAEQKMRLAELEKKVLVRSCAVDIADQVPVAALFEKLSQQADNLTGVIHAAMVLDDDKIEDLDLERLHCVGSPKVDGLKLLDLACRENIPRFFVALSSIAALIGNPGQAAYAAANAAMEEVVRARAASGLPALSIGLGPVKDQGLLAEDERLRGHLERQLGNTLMTTEQVLEALEDLLARPPEDPVIYAAEMPWGQLSGPLRSIDTPRFERVDRSRPIGFGQEGCRAVDLAELDDEAARAKILDALLDETARILRLPLSEIDPLRPMMDLGFDSLMAVDLKLATESHLGISMPLMALGDQITLAELAGKILARIRTSSIDEMPDMGLIDDLAAKHTVEENLQPDARKDALLEPRQRQGTDG